MKYFLQLISMLTLLSLMISGCSILKPVKIEPLVNYKLTQINPDNIKTPRQSDKVKSKPITLLISIPVAAPGYDTYDMAYLEHPYELNYFAKSRWIAPPAQMLVPLIVESLQQTNKYKVIVIVPYSGFSDQRLDVQLIDIYQDFSQRPSKEKVAIRAQIIDMHSYKVIASKQFAVVKTAPEDTPYGGVVAANQAIAAILDDLADFCVKNS